MYLLLIILITNTPQLILYEQKPAAGYSRYGFDVSLHYHSLTQNSIFIMLMQILNTSKLIFYKLLQKYYTQTFFSSIHAQPSSEAMIIARLASAWGISAGISSPRDGVRLMS